MAELIPDSSSIAGVPNSITHIIRMFNTNVDGTKKVCEAITQIRGIGPRIADAIVKRTKIDPKKRAGELNEEELQLLNDGISNPSSLNIPDWMFNRRFDVETGATSHLIGTQIDATFRLQLERGKKIGLIRAFRLANGLKVNGQRTKSNGRRGRTVGVIRKK